MVNILSRAEHVVIIRYIFIRLFSKQIHFLSEPIQISKFHMKSYQFNTIRHH